MTRYRVWVRESPGRQLRRVRSFQALNDQLARAQAVQAAEQFAHQARVARYRITWELYELTWPAGEWVKRDAGALVSARDRREGQT
jgi:hypothetical protein